VQAGNELSLLTDSIPSEGGYQATLSSEVAQVHERLVSRGNRVLTTIEAVYIPEDDLFDQAAQSVFGYLDSSIVLSRDAYRDGRLPAVDILASESGALNPNNVSKLHYQTANEAKSLLKKAELLERIVSLVGESELSEEDRIIYQRANKIKNYMTQSFFVAEKQTGRKGVYVPVQDTVNAVKEIIDGKYDDISEDKFMFIENISDIEKIKNKRIKEEIKLMKKMTKNDYENTKLYVIVRSKDGVLFSDDVFSVTSKNEKGVFDILPYHENFISLISDFIITDKNTSDERRFNIEKGILYMIENKINIYVGL
jgi:F-type H+-transporting ATPase subunit beta